MWQCKIQPEVTQILFSCLNNQGTLYYNKQEYHLIGQDLTWRLDLRNNAKNISLLSLMMSNCNIPEHPKRH